MSVKPVVSAVPVVGVVPVVGFSIHVCCIICTFSSMFSYLHV